MKKTFRTNPPWADKILGKHWNAIQRVFGEKYMPLVATEVHGAADLRRKVDEWQGVIDKGNNSEYVQERHAEVKAKLDKLLKRKNKSYQEFGCGHYGCVMPTHTQGIVFKVTTDPTEAAFVAAYLSWPKHLRPNGIVGYHKVVAIRSESHLKRPVFVLLRDEARHIGSNAIEQWIRSEKSAHEKEYYSRSFRNVVRAISNTLDSAREVRRLTLKKPNAQEMLKQAMDRRQDAWEMGPRAAQGRDTVLKMAFQLQRFEENATEMENEPMGVEIGRALRECLNDHGLLLADVHTNNIGMPGPQALIDEIGKTPIITDPGHAIPVDDRYDGLKTKVEEI